MTIFGNVRQWNRPRALGRWGGWWWGGGRGGQGQSRLGSLKPRRGSARTPATAGLPRARCAAGVSAARSPDGEGSAAPPPPAPVSSSSSSPPGPPPPASPRAPPCKVESGVDVSESTWYRGWRIKSVELNSCHCSDSSRAERRGSERSSEQVSGARGTERERGAGGRGEGRRSGAGRAAPGAGRVPLRPARLELRGAGAGRLQPVQCPSRPETPAARRPQEVYSQPLF